MGKHRTPEQLARAYLRLMRQLHDVGKGMLRRPHENPELDPYYETLVACFHYGQRGELLPGFDRGDIAVHAALRRRDLGSYPAGVLARPLRKAVKRAESPEPVTVRA